MNTVQKMVESLQERMEAIQKHYPDKVHTFNFIQNKKKKKHKEIARDMIHLGERITGAINDAPVTLYCMRLMLNNCISRGYGRVNNSSYFICKSYEDIKANELLITIMLIHRKYIPYLTDMFIEFIDERPYMELDDAIKLFHSFHKKKKLRKIFTRKRNSKKHK